MEQQIHFCTTDDKVRIAYATVGERYQMVKDLLADLRALKQEREFDQLLQSRS